MYNIGDDSYIRLGVGSFDGEDKTDYPPDIQLTPDLIE